MKVSISFLEHVTHGKWINKRNGIHRLQRPCGCIVRLRVQQVDGVPYIYELDNDVPISEFCRNAPATLPAFQEALDAALQGSEGDDLDWLDEQSGEILRRAQDEEE